MEDCSAGAMEQPLPKPQGRPVTEALEYGSVKLGGPYGHPQCHFPPHENGNNNHEQGDNLLVAPPAALTDEARTMIREHQVELLALGRSTTSPTLLAGVVDWLQPCPICQGVLFNEGVRGGYFCPVCQPLKPEDIKSHVSIGHF